LKDECRTIRAKNVGMSNEEERKKRDGRDLKGSNRKREAGWVRRTLSNSREAKSDRERREVTEGAENTPETERKETRREGKRYAVKERQEKANQKEPQKEHRKKRPIVKELGKMTS
jgi:hypothetical protein